MLNISFSQAIPSIVEAMLPRFSPDNIALAITLDLRDSFYHEDKEGEESTATICRFLFHRPSNYTKVLVNYDFDNFHAHVYPERDLIRYKKYSDHDSCWRSDGLRILHTHWDNVEKHFGKHPNDISQFYSFSIFQPISYVKLITFDSVKEDDSYNASITGYDVQYKKFNINSDNIVGLIPEDK